VGIFLTCWIVFAVHLATNRVREIYLALAIGDHFSFRVDDYANMHSDLFEKKGYGWHIGANPGASMLGAVPYFLSRPLLDSIVRAVNRARAAKGQEAPPQYNSPWPMAREFYREAWRRGYDIKFGLAAIVMQVFCMAPISALGTVAMFYLLRRLFGSDRTGFWLALLYAFGTPVFFRTAFLNRNLILGHFTFMGFLAVWNPDGSPRWSENVHRFLGGVAGRAALLTVLSRMNGQYGDYAAMGVSPLPIFAIVAALLAVIWYRGAGGGQAAGAAGAAGEGSLAGAVPKNQRQDDAEVSVDVVIPVLNEAHVLKRSVQTLLAFLHDRLRYRWHVVIVDNGSTDGTDQVAKQLAAAHREVRFIHLPQPGRGRALRQAWLQSQADVVCYMDVDLSTGLDHIPELLGAIAHEGYDVATGSRLRRESRTRRSLKREIISQIYNLLVKVVLATHFSDAQCGFKAVSRRAVDALVPQIEDQSWFFDTELLVLAEKQGYGIKDIPVVWVDDDDSRVKIMKTSWEDIKGIVRLRWHLWSARLDSGPAAK